jgi:hypothetical protein
VPVHKGDKGVLRLSSFIFAYYIEGDRDIARVLKLKLNINEKALASDAHQMLCNLGTTLFQRTFKDDIPQEFRNALLEGSDLTIVIRNKDVCVSRDVWANGNGYDVKFTIRHPASLK